MDAHFAVSFQIQNLRHPHPRKVPGSTQKWQEGIGVALTVEGWLKALKEDSRAIFRAASEAQKAVDYIMARVAQVDRMAAE